MGATRKRKKGIRNRGVAQWHATTAASPEEGAVRDHDQLPREPSETRSRVDAAPAVSPEQARTIGSVAIISDAIDIMVRALDGDSAPPPQGHSRAAGTASERAATQLEGVRTTPAAPPATSPAPPARRIPTQAGARPAGPTPAQPLAQPLAQPPTRQASDSGWDPPQDSWEPDYPAAASRKRRVLTAVAVILVAPLGFVGALYGTKMATQALNTDEPPGATAPLSPSRTPASVPPSTPASGTTPAPAGYVPGGTTGPGLTTPGVLVQVSPDATGGLEVIERVRFAATTSSLTLAPPVTAGMSKSAVPRAVRVLDLQVSADNSVVSDRPTALTRSTRLALPEGTRTVEMRYRIEGAAIRSTPSTPGRALVLLPPISTGPDLSDQPVVVEVQGDSVRNLQCPALRVGEQLCGRVSQNRWYTVNLTPGATAVLAQLDLPDPVTPGG